MIFDIEMDNITAKYILLILLINIGMMPLIFFYVVCGIYNLAEKIDKLAKEVRHNRALIESIDIYIDRYIQDIIKEK